MNSTEDFAKLFHALGDKTRFRLFQLLGQKNEICVGQLADELNITSACVSQHMKILAEVGLVERVREGQRVCYQVSTNSKSKKVINNLVFK
jgi:ArsR family transcriptional regulator